MAAHGYIPSEPSKAEGSVVQLPWKWCGEVAADGDAQPWISAPLGSEYTRVESGSVTLKIKTADNSADADWQTVTVS